MDKSPDAFRTISEVSEHLDTPAHVLRFWESRFPQIRPVKRAGGRRYYRPSDVALLSGIKRLLHDDGLTIRGVQKILREQGIRHVAALAADGSFEVETDAAIEAALAAEFLTPDPAELPSVAEAETAQVIALQTALTRQERPAPPHPPEEEPRIFAAEPGTAQPEAVETPSVVEIDAQDEIDTASAPESPAPPQVMASSESAVPPDQVTAPKAADQPVEPGTDAVAPEGHTIAALLRLCTPVSVAPHQAELIVLRDRLRDLRGRLAAGARRRPR